MEYWHNSEFLRSKLEKISLAGLADRMEEHLDQLLPALKSANGTATFFVLGSVAEKYPHLLRRIAGDGHEIASHGHSHLPLHRLTPESFRAELRSANAAIQSATGKRPAGFRAPRFSLTPRTAWAIPVLREEGFTYDSSIFPSPLTPHGSRRAPRTPYRIAAPDIFTPSPDGSALLELPVAVYPLAGIRIPMGGGIYFRALPGFLTRSMIGSLARRQPTTLYFHTHEFDPVIGKSLPFRSPKTFVKYVGTKGSWENFLRLIGSIHPLSIEQYLLAHAVPA
jgi:polysaccharide deacetylase family protein (PEP-CTERM system associated)